MEIHTIISFVIDKILAALGFFRHRRVKKYQDFEYAIRLQIQDEKPIISSRLSQSAFQYTAKIINSGTKPTEIDRIYIDCGSDNDPKKRFKYVVTGKFYLSPGDHREIKFNLTRSELEDAMRKFEIRQCMFSFCVSYRKATGDIAQAERYLGSCGKKGIIFGVYHGSVLV